MCFPDLQTIVISQIALLIVLHYRRRELREHIRDHNDLASHLLPLHVGMLRAAAAVYLLQVKIHRFVFHLSNTDLIPFNATCIHA